MNTKLAPGTTVAVATVLLLLSVASSLKAQSGFAAHTFGPSHSTGGILGVNTNADGINPNGWFAQSDSTLYGSTQNGGTNGYGTLFSFNSSGTFKLIYTFPFDDVGTGNTNGANPNGGLTLVSNLLYGTTSVGGTNDQGIIFAINTNGSGFQVLHTFSNFINTNILGNYTNSDGANPSAGLVASGKKLYGTTLYGGSGGNGAVFSCSNTSYTVIHHFTAGNVNPNINQPYGMLTNGDGANPGCQLLLSGTNLFGTTSSGGTNGYGTVFMMSTNGSKFVTLHHFDTNGANPSAGLVLSGGTLFGVSGSVVYSLNTNGTGFSILHQFDSSIDTTAYAMSGLMVTNGTLYGITSSTGTNNDGQIFSLSTNGMSFVLFHEFSALPFGYPAPPKTNWDGAFPNGGMTILSGALYGAASQGGTNANGAIFLASPPPPALVGQPAGQNLNLSFETFDGLNYTIQQSTNLASTAWTSLSALTGNGAIMNSSAPTTNLGSMFFRVRQP